MLSCFCLWSQILPADVLYTETGELTETGRSYVPPRVLQEALSVICSVAAQWNAPDETEKLALEILIVTHHPSIGASLSKLMNLYRSILEKN